MSARCKLNINEISRRKTSRLHVFPTQHPEHRLIEEMADSTNSKQPVVIESDNEADQQRGAPVPESELPLLRDAINNASQTVLAKTLLEICEQNEASRVLAQALPLPPPVPQETKRRASPTEGIDRTCEHCGHQFSNTMQIMEDCRYHPGELYPWRLRASD